MLMWSVVHLPLALINSTASVMFFPSHAGKGSSSCRRWLSGFTTTSTLLPSAAGSLYPASFTSKPMGGSSIPCGSSSFTATPSSFTRVSVSGLKVKSPAMARAVTISGLATKAWVFGLPSLRLAKFRLKLVMMEFLRLGSSLWRAH